MRNHLALCLSAAGGLTLASIAAPVGAEVGRAHQIMIDRGFQIQAQVLTAMTNPPSFDLQQFLDAGFTTPNWQAQPIVLPTGSDQVWGNWASGVPAAPGSYSSELQQKLVSLQLGDEQNVNDVAVRQTMIDAVNASRTQLPNTLVFTNQVGGPISQEANMRDYIQRGKPDMLMFDTYTFSNVSPFGSWPRRNSFAATTPPLSSRSLYQDMGHHRQLALEGLTGDGSQPIPYGLYTQTFRSKTGAPHNRFPSESEYRANNFAALTFGYTFLSSYFYSGRVTTDNAESFFFSTPGDSSPTAALGWATRMNHEIQNLGPTMVRLISTDVRIVAGEDPSGLPISPVAPTLWNAAADPYITSITTNNTGSANGGHEGDVLVGYFNVLDESFDGDATDELYFMIHNGLMDPSASAADASQTISMLFNFGSSGITSLQRLSRDTGEVEVVDLTALGGSLYALNLTLEGGTADLFKFNTGADFVTIPEPATFTIGLLAVLARMPATRRQR